MEEKKNVMKSWQTWDEGNTGTGTIHWNEEAKKYGAHAVGGLHWTEMAAERHRQLKTIQENKKKEAEKELQHAMKELSKKLEAKTKKLEEKLKSVPHFSDNPEYKRQKQLSETCPKTAREVRGKIPVETTIKLSSLK